MMGDTRFRRLGDRVAGTMAAVGLLYMEALKAHASVQMHETNQQLLSDLLAFSRRRQAGGMNFSVRFRGSPV